MSHHCPAAVIACEDFRLHQRQDGRNYISELITNFKVDCDLITRAGGIQDLVRPKEPGFKDSLLRDLGVSVNLHQAATVYLINHQDCGAYNDFNFSSPGEEFKQHSADLSEAKKIIENNFAGIAVKIFYARLASKQSDSFIFEEII